MLQAGPTLLKKYAHLIATRAIFGCYMQTELGHGTNVSRLETTATFIPESQEFEIHSPTLTSSKWWIGALGKTATHGVIQAKLILPGGKDMGPHLFFMQLRSMGKKLSFSKPTYSKRMIFCRRSCNSSKYHNWRHWYTDYGLNRDRYLSLPISRSQIWIRFRFSRQWLCSFQPRSDSQRKHAVWIRTSNRRR